MTLRRIMRAINDIAAVNPMLGGQEEPAEDSSAPDSETDRYGALEIP